MKNKTFAFVFLFLFPSDLSAQDVSDSEINTTGSCNANVQGSGNHTTVNCFPNQSPQSSSALLVVSVDSQWGVTRFSDYDQFGRIQPFIFHSGIVDFSNSTISVRIEDEEFFGYLNEDFDGGDITIDLGPYPFVMEASFEFFNGFYQDVKCNGILNVESSAQIMPYFNIWVDQMRQRIRAMDCGFMANPV